MTTTPDAATIAASIDVSTAAGWNLRALLLRVADDDDWRVAATGDYPASRRPSAQARRSAVGLGLAFATEPGLTPLGREVAERLRPVPWLVEHIPDLREWWVRPSGVGDTPRCRTQECAERIAALLTADDLRVVKRYRSGP